MLPSGTVEPAGRLICLSIRFYGELNDFLPEQKRGQAIHVGYVVSPSVKDAIEGLGVPHVEVHLILTNGRSVPFNHRVASGDRISVYPAFRSFDISTLTCLQQAPLTKIQFVADVHLRRLARLLRWLGFDVLHSASCDDADLIEISTSQHRILLTRDRALLRHGNLMHGYWVRPVHPHEQAVDVIRRFDLARAVRPFTRCPICNGRLESVEKQQVLPRIPPRTAAWLDAYVECIDCGKLYWEGTHSVKIHAAIASIVDEAQDR